MTNDMYHNGDDFKSQIREIPVAGVNRGIMNADDLIITSESDTRAP